MRYCNVNPAQKSPFVAGIQQLLMLSLIQIHQNSTNCQLNESKESIPQSMHGNWRKPVL